MPVLDRRVPSDWKHVSRHRIRQLMPTPPAVVEKILPVPRSYRDDYDQGEEGACVGFSQSWMMSILNKKLYAARKLYQEAQLIDEWGDTPPAEGTSLRAGFDVLRTQGHWCIDVNGECLPVSLEEGIAANRWATGIDEIRTAIEAGIPVNFGINWYQQFSRPVKYAREVDGRAKPRYEYYIGLGAQWGKVLGGHAITCVGASDARQAFALCNTWGTAYPFLVWLPYGAETRLLDEEGEAGIVTDR